MKRSTPIALAMLLAACAGADDDMIAPPPAMACDAEAAALFVGERATAVTGQAIRAASGAEIFEWVPPDSAVTMDYRAERVRVYYDRQKTIAQISCG